jgi:hypothetical protein
MSSDKHAPTIYVAGASREVEHVRSLMNLIAPWFRITHDWTEQVMKARASGKSDTDFSVGERRAYARSDLDGVFEADFLWLIAPEVGTTGAWVELGAALAYGKTIVVSGPQLSKTIFSELATFRCKTHEEAVELLKRAAGAAP